MSNNDTALELRKLLLESLSDIIKNREKIKEDFLRAFLAVNMPDNATQDWIINNLTLCIQPAHTSNDNTERYWIEFKKTGNEE
jgi:hypothetical protein